MVFILDHLAVGSASEAAQRPGSVTAALCVAEEVELENPPPVYHKVPMTDMVPIPATQLREALAWIDGHIRDHRILVFCNAGVGRSSSVAVAYLCGVLGYGFGTAVEMVARRKPRMSILPELITVIDSLREEFRGNREPWNP
jgi:protein-tyrosine phosphatase